MTIEELDSIALGGGIVGSIGYGYALTGEISPNGDWSAQWIDRRGMANHGTLVLVGLSPRARALRREGVIRMWVRQGLDRRRAERLYHTGTSYKFELVRTLVEVLADPAEREAYLAHPATYGPGSGRVQWWRRWREVLVERNLSAPRESALAKMVQALV